MVEKRISLQAEVSVIAARGLDGARRAVSALREPPPQSHPRPHHRARARCRRRWRRRPPRSRAASSTRSNTSASCASSSSSAPTASCMVNELAPRPHNSGHLTFDAAVTSQFEQQVRAICGLPLGSPELLRPAAMANLLGDLWADGEPDWAAACRLPDVKLHLYGKITPETRPQDGAPHGDGTYGARGTGPRDCRARCTAEVESPHGGVSMDAIDVAQQYFDAWNRRDPAAVLAHDGRGRHLHRPHDRRSAERSRPSPATCRGSSRRFPTSRSRLPASDWRRRTWWPRSG